MNRQQQRAEKHNRAKFKNSRERQQHRARCRVLARQIVIHGKREAGSDGDFAGGIRRPLTMTEKDAERVYNWAIETPNRWYCRALAWFRANDGEEYISEVYHEVGQQLRSDELAEERRKLLKEARDGGNPNHLVAEGFEMGIL